MLLGLHCRTSSGQLEGLHPCAPFLYRAHPETDHTSVNLKGYLRPAERVDMPSAITGQTPSLSSFIRSLKTHDIETSIELFTSLLKRRQIKHSRPCAIATAQLLLRVVAAERIRDAQKLMHRIRDVGRRLVAAQPREMTVGNVVRRVLGVIREVAEEDDDGETNVVNSSGDVSSPVTASAGALPSRFSGLSLASQGSTSALNAVPRSGTTDEDSVSVDESADGTARRPNLGASASYAGSGPQSASLLSLLEHPLGRSPAGTPPGGAQSPSVRPTGRNADASNEKIDIKAEVIEGINQLIEELDVVDDQIAESALNHIHSNETILTHTSSQTVQKFLMAAARKRKFTVVHAEAYPNDHEATHDTIMNGGRKTTATTTDDNDDPRWKPLTAMGITVILIPDTAVFALMSRINKVLLSPHTVLSNGSLLAAAGSSTIALAAKAHHVPVVVLSGVYKLSPVYPFDTSELIEYGDPGKVVPFEDGEFMDKIDVANPLYDWVEAECVDLYVTNLGGCAPGFLYRIVKDHYRIEDVDLGEESG